jgi:hypothetical protein
MSWVIEKRHFVALSSGAAYRQVHKHGIYIGCGLIVGSQLSQARSLYMSRTHTVLRHKWSTSITSSVTVGENMIQEGA